MADDARTAKGEALIVDHKPTFGGRGGGTRSAIKRDKAIALQSPDVDSMEPEEVTRLLEDICRSLSVSSLHSVRDALARLRAAVALIPKLETFTASVIATVAKGHSTAIDAAAARAAKRPATRPPSTPKAVLVELQKWQRERCGGSSHD